MSEGRLLLVDDEESFRKLVSRELSRAGFVVETAGTIAAAREAIGRQSFHVVLLDLRLPDGNGIELLSDIKSSLPGTKVVVLTAYGTVEEAIAAMKEGAHDFLTKPCKLNELEVVIQKALDIQSLERGNIALQRDLERLQPSDRFIGETGSVQELHALVARVAGTDSTVLVRGESGVGKELVARAVHRLSGRAKEPFVVVDCASLHENLLQSELFGHEKGAYTGAIRLKHGLFEVADRGTIFLDEIAEITPPLQVKLLRVLETGVFRRVGGTVDVKVNVRVIAATNRDLEEMIREGSFREDLYYRLNVFSLQIPPLRERCEDIPLIVDHFVRHSAIVPKRRSRVSPEAMEALQGYPWPGNARELENVIERALILCDSGMISPEHLPHGVRMRTSADGQGPMSRRPTLEEVESSYVRQVLDECKGHRQTAARILGISERNLYRKLKELETQ